MIFTVPLRTGTTLANVRYKWLAAGSEGPELVFGITQPDATFPIFRIEIDPPANAEELIVYDTTDTTNWNIGDYDLVALQQGIITVAVGAGISPSLASIKIACASYLRRDPIEFISNGIDLFLLAVNNARKQAEASHDFEYSRIVATLAVVPGGASLKNVSFVEGEATASIKSVTGIRRLGTNGFFYPLDFTRWGIAQERDRSALELRDDYWTILRYPSDADVLNFYGTNTSVVQRGRKLFLYPGFSGQDPQSITLYIDGYGWLNPYGSVEDVTEPEDFIVENGLAYLQWATICELNKMFATFVPRQEGNLSEPTKERDEALKQLVLWDDYLEVEGLTRTS